jgi:hypothetical protein
MIPESVEDEHNFVFRPYFPINERKNASVYNRDCFIGLDGSSVATTVDGCKLKKKQKKRAKGTAKEEREENVLLEEKKKKKKKPKKREKEKRRRIGGRSKTKQLTGNPVALLTLVDVGPSPEQLICSSESVLPLKTIHGGIECPLAILPPTRVATVLSPVGTITEPSSPSFNLTVLSPLPFPPFLTSCPPT